MDHIGIIDIGTGSLRLTIFDSSAKIVDTRQVENQLLYPEPGYVEQDTNTWWNNLVEMFQDLDDDIRGNISAISVTGQREGIVPVNEQFEPLANLITWLDARTGEQADRILEEVGEEFIYNETGLVHNPAWSLSKILWIKENQPAIYYTSFKFLQAVDYLQSRFSGKACTDVSMASRTCMLNVQKRDWSEKIIRHFDIDTNKIPELFEPGDEIGTISPISANQLGLSENVVIHAGAGDQQVAAVGAGAFKEGIASIGIGTASALSMTISQPRQIHKVKIILNCAAVPGKWEYEPPIWNTGSLIKWFHDNMGMPDCSYEEMLAGVEKIPEGANGLIALPYFTGAGSPRWDPHLSGGFYGVNLTHNRIHFLRALMEAIAYEIRYNIEYIENNEVPINQVVLSGGASQNKVLCQIISDVLQKPVRIFSEAEASSWGLYCLIKNRIQKDSTLESVYQSLNLDFISQSPNPLKKEVYDEQYQRYLVLGDKLSQLNFKN
jgi:xylulokinase